MWFLKKKEIYNQIEVYDRNTEFLMVFAQFTKVNSIQEVTREHLKSFYKTHISTVNGMFYKIEYIKYLNKFLRAYGVPLILRIEEVIEYTPNSAIIESMTTLNPHNPTPKHLRNKKIVALKNKGWSYSEICAEMKLRSKATVHEIYHREKKRIGLSTV